MISERINLTTGPVSLSQKTRTALYEQPLSHRSAAFQQLHAQTTDFLKGSFQVNEVFILTGSGTLANEVMLQEIKCIAGKGLILSNGEFGARLIDQATRNRIDHINYTLAWGENFDLNEIDTLIKKYSIKWILFCHCETSTGVINEPDKITSLARVNNCLCFVDCMSTVGTMSMDLSAVAMATASSGKGFASVPGLSIIFSNIEPTQKTDTPVYLDLYHYKKKEGIPFTLSSNLLQALFISIQQKLHPDQFSLSQKFAGELFKMLDEHQIVPFSNEKSRVFTIVAAESMRHKFIRHLQANGIGISYESDYLMTRGWCQVALFGVYEERELKMVKDCVAEFFVSRTASDVALAKSEHLR